ncbi:hypothetical protein, partial [Parasphingorhabdus sp.]|uniref:hypothetical protein n=1 Tax=Parasphingorhabdus sp. TaxID=2709688 RepID=UPI0032990FB3
MSEYQTDQQTDLSTAVGDQTEHAPQDKTRKTAPLELPDVVPSWQSISQINEKTESAKTAEIKASFSTE